MNRAERVYEYMKNHGSIAPMDAIIDLGYTRLSAAIFEIKKAGHKVKRINETKKNRRGQVVTYARYSLVE